MGVEINVNDNSTPNRVGVGELLSWLGGWGGFQSVLRLRFSRTSLAGVGAGAEFGN